MNQGQASNKKIILRDPVAEFSRLCPEKAAFESKYLSELEKQYRTQKKRYKEIQKQTRLISKKIGELKRLKQPADDLKTEMQEHTNQAKTIADNITKIEKQILGFFDFESEQEVIERNSLNESGTRYYPSTSIDNHDIVVSILNNEREDWNNYVSRNSAASVYHLAEWRDVIQNSFGHESYYIFSRDTNDSINGILPLIRLKSRLFGDFMVSMPYFNYGGAVADHPLIEEKLMEAANTHAARLGSSHVEYRDDIPRKGLPARTEKVNMMLSLPKSEDELWQGFTPKLRAQIKRPQRENPQVFFGRIEYLDDFYMVFARNMRDLGTPVYSKSFFYNILDHFPSKASIMVVRLAGKPVAAGFLLGDKEQLEIPWASSLKSVNHFSINMLLYWEVLKYAVANGYKYFDFGRSSKNSGTYRFKQQWGAEPKQLHWHYWLNSNCELPSLNPSNPKYALMINVWKRLPVPLTNWLGPKIVKNLP
jgi:serine/alanine adding enzyme